MWRGVACVMASGVERYGCGGEWRVWWDGWSGVDVAGSGVCDGEWGGAVRMWWGVACVVGWVERCGCGGEWRV